MAEYVQTPGGTVVLPDYTRPDMAFTETLAGVTPTILETTIYAAVGLYFDVVIDYTVQYRTGGSAGDRVPVLIVKDENKNAVAFAPPPAPIPASVIAFYNWNSAVSDSFAVVSATNNRYMQVAFPLVALLPGWSLVMEPDGALAGDLFIMPNLTILHVPTGPPLASGAPAVAATPILV